MHIFDAKNPKPPQKNYKLGPYNDVKLKKALFILLSSYILLYFYIRGILKRY